MRTPPILALLLCLTAASLAAEPPYVGPVPVPVPAAEPPADLAGTVASVWDGDSVRVADDGQEQAVRLFGVDCPELDQPRGRDAANFARALIDGRRVAIARRGTSWGRLVAQLRDDRGRDVAAALVAAGWAWHDDRYARLDTDYGRELAARQAEARAAGLGLWADPAPIRPRDWRRGAR